MIVHLKVRRHEYKVPMANPTFGYYMLGYMLHITHLAFKHGYLHAIIMVEMDMHSRQ
jgi:hypothetical protein